jgi:2-polyprenyl-6-methoxyphenol hydroxylase-like FAD-dependent oxidoreductase
MPAVSRVLINGAGPAGLSAAISLNRLGVEARVLEKTPDQWVLGSELLLSAPSLRSLASLGVTDAVLERSVPISDLVLHAPDDSVVATVPLMHLDPELPPSVGITRRALHDALRDAAAAAGVPIDYGVSVEAIKADGDGAVVTSTDGRRETYDLVIAADGVASRVRQLAFGAAADPEYVGQCVWRARVPRRGDAGLHGWNGEKANAGIITVSADTAYLFCLQSLPTAPRIEPEDYPRLLREELAEFGEGVIGWTRDQLEEPENIHFSPMWAGVLPLPWHRGPTVLIGDAVHPTTPHIGYGAGLAIEDGIVLADEIDRATGRGEALTQFGQRRHERCRMVVEGGIQISKWQQDAQDHSREQALLTHEIWDALAERP